MKQMKFQSKIIYRNNNECFIFNSNELILTILDPPTAQNYFRANIICVPQNSKKST